MRNDQRDDGERDDDEERHRKIDADAALVEFLRQKGFRGPEYDTWERKLVQDTAIRLSWSLSSGRAFDDSRARGGVKPSSNQRKLLKGDYAEAESLAGRLIVLSLQPFRTSALIGHGWDPAKGATISEFYYGATIQRLREGFRAWERTQRHVGRLTKEQVRAIFRLEAAGTSVVDIAATMKLPRDVVSQVLRGDIAAEGEYVDDADDAWSPDDEHASALDQMQILEAFERLIMAIPEDLREVAQLLYQGYRPFDISLKLNISVRQVRSAIRKIRIALRAAGYGPSDDDQKKGDK